MAILEKVEGTDAAFCVSVFVALRKLANDAGCPDGPVALTINQIAGAAGCSYRKAANVLGVLKSVGVITIASKRIAGTKSHAPSTYSFPTLGTICRTLGTDRRSIRAETIQVRKEGKELGAASASPSVASNGSMKSQKPILPRSRNPLLDCLATLDGSDPAQVTASAWSGFGKALKEIQQVCQAVTPDEIRRRVGNYRLHFRDATISPHAIAKHWSRCDRGPGGGTQPDAPLKMIS